MPGLWRRSRDLSVSRAGSCRCRHSAGPTSHQSVSPVGHSPLPIIVENGQAALKTKPSALVLSVRIRLLICNGSAVKGWRNQHLSFWNSSHLFIYCDSNSHDLHHVPMKALVLSSLFPNPVQRRHGIFIEHRIAATYSNMTDLRVVAPVPWFPSRNERWGRYASYSEIPRSTERRGLSIDHPRYLTVPKLGQTIAPALMAASLYGYIARLRRTFDFDIIDSYYLYPDGVAASWLAKMFDRPFIMSALGTDVSLIPNWFPSRKMIVEAVRQSAATTAVCKALVQGLENIGAPAGKMQVIEHGVDLKMFRPADDRAQLRLRLGFHGPTILSVGHLIERKGHDLAIRAIAGLPRRPRTRRSTRCLPGSTTSWAPGSSRTCPER